MNRIGIADQSQKRKTKTILTPTQKVSQPYCMKIKEKTASTDDFSGKRDKICRHEHWEKRKINKKGDDAKVCSCWCKALMRLGFFLEPKVDYKFLNQVDHLTCLRWLRIIKMFMSAIRITFKLLVQARRRNSNRLLVVFLFPTIKVWIIANNHETILPNIARDLIRSQSNIFNDASTLF